ncbi:PREDICTED: uncharacterized protein LOC109212034 [Nicotiana attenuata]|uniref:Uncharacterized protein n=1 Tax=Nicotiana attenuata TaxID=49451 RepID=A0A314KI81_NICAT|nr:PREDICTED: uncharacterized protein LOC109212034 [Nicotiana attenuata]OIT28918.1 hypothetical protein A4A49_22269 [Nicotiana attenuata]
MVFLVTPFEFLNSKAAEESESSILVGTPAEFLDCKSAEKSDSSNLDSSGTRGTTMERKILVDFLKEVDEFENMNWSDTVEEKKIEPKSRKTYKAKDWKRTLACKFYEERENASDSRSEGMDLLWEKYEMDAIKNSANRNNRKKKKMKRKGELKSYFKEEKREVNEHIEQLCCLQALKLSARKVNLGIGRANIVRISKAIKGFGWLYHVNKKVHCGDRF